MKKNNSIFLLSSAVLAGPLFFVAKSAAESTSCIDLTQYISQEDGGNDDLSILMDGGDIPNNAPVYFDVPAQFTIPGESLDYCIENITIPNSVGENDCSESQNCWLAVGLMATAPDGDLATESCVSSDGDTSGCYACTCTGSSMSSGIEEDSGSVSQGCGLSSDSQWGMTCHDTTNGRFTWIGTNNTRQESSYSYVEVSVCPESTSGCGVCQDGGLHPSFRVRFIVVRYRCFWTFAFVIKRI